MDLNYSYSLLSLAVGILSGFQLIAEKYRESPFRAAWTWAGWGYLSLRGLVSSILFLTLYVPSYWLSVFKNWPLPLVALFCGTSAEIILRTKIFIREKKKPGGGVEEVFLEPLKLILFFQDFFLTAIKEQLKIAKAKARVNRLRANLPKDITFEELCKRVLRNLQAFDHSAEREKTRDEIEKLSEEYNGGLQSETKRGSYEDEFKEKLGYLLLNLVGEGQFLILVAELPQYRSELSQNHS
ncbi:MAG: hypothetical protein ACREBG_17590 [Pyrinomonadaceae bacterium]